METGREEETGRDWEKRGDKKIQGEGKRQKDTGRGSKETIRDKARRARKHEK